MNKYEKYFIICVIISFFVIIGAFIEKNLIITHPYFIICAIAYWALFGATCGVLIRFFIKLPK